MPYTVHIDPEVNCAFVRLTGKVNFKELDESTSEIIKHPSYRDGMNILRDAREQIVPKELSFKDMSVEAGRQMKRHDLILGKCRWAVLVSDANAYAKVHQFIVTGRLQNHTVERKPFRDIMKALAWLGLPEGYEIEYPETGEAT